MEKILYVLGAGFSKEAGYPLTYEFTSKKLIREFRKTLSKKEKTRMDKVTKYFQDRIKKKYCKNDIESVLNHVAVAEYLDMASMTESAKSYDSFDIYNDLKWYVVKILQWRSDRKLRNEYYDFLKKIYQNDDDIISFNYDLVIESVLAKLGITCDYGLNQKPLKDSQLLLKMHGSVNWAQCNNCENFAFFSDNVAVKILSQGQKCPHCKKNSLLPIIIPPVLYKENYFRTSKLFKLLWGHANEIITQANKIVFIGFSMRDSDSYAQELFKLSSNMSPLQIQCQIITNSKKKRLFEIQKRYRQVLVGDKIRTRNMKFTKFAQKM